MINMQIDLAIIGGGPAGLAAAIEAKRQGISQVIIIDRDVELGGILQQCIHDGFGLQRFGRKMSGGQYAETFIRELETTDVEVKLNTVVLEITRDKIIYAMNPDEGMMRLECGAIILAMGCRERTRSQVFIYGSRPSGVLTAGTVQRYINIEGYLPGQKAVILGSGDIGLIVARRMILEGMQVEGVYEALPYPGGLKRNIVQCLEDYNIPMHLSTTVVKIHGKHRIEGVSIAQVDENRIPVKGTARYVSCDLLVLAVGLIPENELSLQLGVELSPVTKGPVVDESFMTSVEGVFAAGNVVAVFDLVDYVSETGEYAAQGAAKYLHGKLNMSSSYMPVQQKGHVSYVLPQRIRPQNIDDNLTLYLRVKHPGENVVLCCEAGGQELCRKRQRFISPSRMIIFEVKKSVLNADGSGGLVVSVKEARSHE